VKVRRRSRVYVDRTPRHRFTLQELADLVELCARKDMAPGTAVRLYADGQEIRSFRVEVISEAEGD
jgi:hypothetical protein